MTEPIEIQRSDLPSSVEGREQATAPAAEGTARETARITLILTVDDERSLRYTEGSGEFILPRPVTVVSVRTDKEPGLRFALYRDRTVWTRPFYEADATPQEQPIEGGEGTVTVTVRPLPR
jgi:hypothetical protein